MLDGEALVADSGDEEAVLKLLFHFVYCFFLFGAANGGFDFGGNWGFGREVEGGGAEGVSEVGIEGEGGGERRRRAGGWEGEESGFHCCED